MKYLYKKFSILLKADKQLSKEEKFQMHRLLVKMYPRFKNLFDKNEYFSTVRPQMNFLVKKAGELIGTGKFLWRNIKIKNESIKLFAFGMVVAKRYQNQGIGTKIVALSIQNAKKRKADLLYASTSNSKVKKMLSQLKFQIITAPIFYKDVISKDLTREKGAAYIFEFKPGLKEKINILTQIYLGVGPI